MDRQEQAFWRTTFRQHNRRISQGVPDRWNLDRYFRGTALLRLGHPRQALRDFARALRRDPDDASARFARANALFDLERYAEAVVDYDRAIAAFRDDRFRVVALYNRALAQTELGHQETALADYGRALELSPDYPDALNNRGNLLGEMGRTQEALEDFDRALALTPDDPLLPANRARLAE